MGIIDSHIHLYPSEVSGDPSAWAKARGETHWATLCTRRRSDGRPVQSFPSVDELLRDMDRAGVERAVLLGWYWENPETCAWQNRFYAECVRAHPRRLAAYATIHPRLGLWPTLDEMHRARDGGLTGIGELSPHAQGYSIDDPVFREVVTLAGDWKMPVNLHVTDPDGRDYPGRVATPMADFVRLAQACPKTRFVLAHWGGLLPLRDESARRQNNLYYDTAASPLLYEADVWQRFLAVVPETRVLFGSDYPLNNYPKLESAPEMVRLIAEARSGGAGSDVFSANAARLLSR